MPRCPYIQKPLFSEPACIITKTKVTGEYFEKFCLNAYVDCKYYRTAEPVQIKSTTLENKQSNEPLRVKIIDKSQTTDLIKKESPDTNPVSTAIPPPESIHTSDANSILNELNNAWQQYELKAKEIIKRWETERGKIISEMLNEHSKLNSILINEEELEGRKIVGFISNEEYNALKSKINKEKKIIEDKIKEYIERITLFEKELAPHRERLNLTLKQEELDMLNKKLTDLENAKEKGMVSSITYERLKREIISQINLLKEIYTKLNEKNK